MLTDCSFHDSAYETRGPRAFLTDGVSVVHVKEEDDSGLRVRVEFLKGGGARLQVHQPPLEDVHEGQPPGRAEAGAAVVHDAVGPHVLGGDLIHAAAAHENLADVVNRIYLRKKTFVKKK